MGKAFKSSLCTYCSVAGSTSADRVFAHLIPGLGVQKSHEQWADERQATGPAALAVVDLG